MTTEYKTCFIDTNILIYHTFSILGHYDKCLLILEDCSVGKIQAFFSLHKYRST